MKQNKINLLFVLKVFWRYLVTSALTSVIYMLFLRILWGFWFNLLAVAMGTFISTFLFLLTFHIYPLKDWE